MLILQKPEGYCFEKNIADLLIQKQNDETNLTFELKLGDTLILTENYVFDVYGYVKIKNLNEIISAYLLPAVSSDIGFKTTLGLINAFSFSINSGTENGFTVIHTDAEMPETLDVEDFIRNNFLTRLPLLKRTAPGRNEYLTYIHLDEYLDVLIKYKINYKLAGVITSKTGTLLLVPSAQGHRHITFSASLDDIIAAADIVPDAVLDYSIYLEHQDGTDDLSREFVYMVDYNVYRNTCIFEFENAFGLMETFTTTGIQSSEIKNDYNISNIKRRFRKTSQDFLAQNTVNTGFLSAAEMDWINDLLNSYNAKVNQGTGLEDIVLLSHDKTDTNKNELRFFKFSYMRSSGTQLQLQNNNTGTDSGIFDNTFDSTFN